MARRPKRTYNQETGEWEVEQFYDSRDDQGRYFKDGIEVDRYGDPWVPMTEEQAAANTSTPGTGVGGGPVPAVGDQSISEDDPRNIIMGESSIDLMTGEQRGTGLVGSSSASTEGGGYGKKRRGQVSRGQMNLTGSRGRSILTS